MNLKHLTDRALLAETKKLASDERRITTQVLHHLKEIERRKLYSDLKFSSLYDYCVRELGYSEGTAYRRISAARLLNEIPEIENKLNSGKLNLTNVASLVQFFKENEIEGKDDKQKIIAEVEGLSRRECELKLMQLSDKPQEDKKHCIWIKDSTMELLKDYRNLKGTHESWEEILSQIAMDAVSGLQKMKFKLVKSPRVTETLSSRIPSSSVKREVYLRDKKCVKCGSVFGLQYDHRKPYSLGGKSDPENIRLLCANCNQRERIRQRL